MEEAEPLVFEGEPVWVEGDQLQQAGGGSGRLAGGEDSCNLQHFAQKEKENYFI